MLIKTSFRSLDLAQESNSPVTEESKQAVLHQQKLVDGQEKVQAVSEILKLVSELGVATGADKKWDVNLGAVNGVSIFVQEMSKRDLAAEQKLPGMLARASLATPPKSASEALGYKQAASDLDCLSLMINHYAFPGIGNIDYGPVPQLGVNLLSVGSNALKVLNTDPSAPITFGLHNSLNTGKSLLSLMNDVVKADGNTSPFLNQSISYTSTAMAGVTAWQSFADVNATPYRKIMDGLIVCASALDTLAGSFAGWQNLKNVAGVTKIVLTLADEVLTLNFGKEAVNRWTPRR